MDGRLEQANNFDEWKKLSQGCNKCLFCYKISAKCQCTAETKVIFWSYLLIYPLSMNLPELEMQWKKNAIVRSRASGIDPWAITRYGIDDCYLALLLPSSWLLHYYIAMLLCWWLLHDARISNGSSLHRLARKRLVVCVLQHNITSHWLSKI